MGSVYKRGKIWWLKYYHQHQGKMVRETSKSTSKIVARNLLKIREGEIAEGRCPVNPFERVTFNDLTDDLLTDYRINNRKSTVRVEQALRLHLHPFFGNMKVTEITTARITGYIRSRQSSGARNATINRELAFLKRMLNIGVQQTPPKVEQMPRIPKLRENNTRKGFFEADQFSRLRDTLPTHLQGLVAFAYKTGWRRSEILNLTWNRVDRDKGIVRLEAGETKNGAGRSVYLDPELAQVIQYQFANQQLGCPYVFQHKGEKIGNLSKAWQSACKRAGIEGKLFHDLRRTAVRNMVRAGISENVAMRISGHRTRSVFDRYDIIDERDLKHAALLQAQYLAKNEG